MRRMIPKSIQDITAADIDGLVVNGISEDIVGAQGAFIQSIRGRRMLDRQLSAVNRSVLVLPDVVVPAADADIPVVFRPAFDRLWHVSGYLGSHSYRERNGMVEWTQDV